MKKVEVTIEGVVIVPNVKIGIVEAGAGAHHKDQDIRGMGFCVHVLDLPFLLEDKVELMCFFVRRVQHIVTIGG
jgi:hypothetical protein